MRKLKWISANVLVIFWCFLVAWSGTTKAGNMFYQLTVYHYEDDRQEKLLHDYLQHALIPALHRMKISRVGVFSAIANDTAKIKSLFVLIPFDKWKQVEKLEANLSSDKIYLEAGSSYINSAKQLAPYKRMEKILLQDFPNAPAMQLPKLMANRKDRVYELRSYESATEKIFTNKMHMFTDGGEIDIFNRLNFNAVFYGKVLAGNKMPNLMYLTSFENLDDRNAHWKSFVDDPAWKELSANPFYQDNVSHIDITLLRPTAYSDY